MKFSSIQVAEALGVTEAALHSMLRRGVIPSPQRLVGGRVLAWTQADLDRAREIVEARRRPSAKPVPA